MRLRKILASICFLAAALQAAGQEAGASREFRYQKETDPYLFLTGPAAVSAFRGHVSMAETSFRKDNGELISLTESPDSYKVGALTESYISVSDKLSFHGKLSWSYFSGEKMGGQILMDPDFNPVNFLESDVTTVGRKNLENYSLLGAAAYSLDDRWALGAGIEYTSADQTKVKDPRFSSVWMDMKLKAGVSFRPVESRLLGVSLVYRSTLEQLRGGIYGTTDKQYFILTDKGGFYGTLDELAGDYNKIPTSSFRPMKNDFYGLSLQFVGGGFSNELEVLYRSGYYGKKSSTTATFFEFSGVSAAYDAQLLAGSGQNLHKATLNLGYELLGNNENLFQYVTKPGENTEVKYTAKNHILDSHRFNAGLGYVWYNGTGGFLPSFTAGATLQGTGYLRKTVLFPFYRNSSSITLSADAFARKSFEKDKSVLSIEINAGFRSGFGNPKSDGAYSSTAASNIQSFDVYLNRQFEYDTATAVSAGAAVCYTYRFTDRFAPYARLSDSFTTLLAAPQYLYGSIRNVALLAIGCTF